MMGFFSRLKTHEPLFRGMADRLGVDFSDWITRHPDHAGDYRTAVLSCTACTAETDCKAWLAEHEHADRAPDYCRNNRLLETLAKT